MSADADRQPEQPEKDVHMTLWEHIGELRKRIFRAAIALLVCAITMWMFADKLLEFVQMPFQQAWIKRGMPGTPELQTLGPPDVFVGKLRLSFIAALIASSPIIFYQLWSFISPGLYKREKRLVIPFVFFSTVLFVSGCAFAYYVAFPFTMNYFFSLLGPIGNSGTWLTHRPTLDAYLDFTTSMLLAFGFVFELPLFISFLVIGGVVTPPQLLRFSRWAILLAFIVGAVVTPGPEVTSQLAVSSALIALYFLSLGIAYVLKPRKKSDSSEV